MIMKWTRWQLPLLQWLLNHSITAPHLFIGVPRVLAGEPMTNAREHPPSAPQGVVILAAKEMQSEETTPCQLCQTGAVEAETLHPPARASSIVTWVLLQQRLRPPRCSSCPLLIPRGVDAIFTLTKGNTAKRTLVHRAGLSEF